MKDRSNLSPFSVLAGAVALLGLGSTGGCVISGQADVPDVQVIQRGIVFSGMPAGLVGDVSMSKSYTQEHSKLEIPGGLDPTVQAFSVMLRATSGVGDLSFIHDLRVTMGADGMATVELGRYEPTPGAPVGPTIGLTTLNPVNVAAAWEKDEATFTLEIVGTLPTNDWTGDVIAHFAGEASLH